MTDLLKSLDELLPTYETILPLSKTQVLFRPFKVKDAKTISVILQENNKKLALKAMIDLIKTCTLNVQIDNLAIADAEYLFLQIRSKSVDEMLNLIKDGQKIQVQISDIQIKNELCEEKIILGTNITAYLKTPKVKDVLRLNSLDKEDIIKASIEKIIVGTEIYDFHKFVPDEIKQILDNLPMFVVPKFEAFLKKQPELFINLNLGEEKKEVSGLLNFFTYR